VIEVVDIPIIGSSKNVPQDDPEYTLNMYGEIVDDEVYTLKPTPGSVFDSQLIVGGGGRGLLTVGERQFGIRGGYFQEKIAGAWIIRGTLSSNVGKVGMAYAKPPSGDSQILIVDDTTGYVYKLADDTFTALSSNPAFVGGGSQAAFCAGRGFVFQPDTTLVQCSEQFDFTIWSGTTTGFFYAESLNTPLLALASNGDFLYCFSSDGFEVQQNQGLSGQPLARVLAGDKNGILAPQSALFINRDCYWLGRTSTGKGIVYRHQGGGRPEAISDNSIDRNIAAMDTPSDAIAWNYESLGHIFYCLTFQKANRTLCYDITTGLWHERCQREPVSGFFNAVPFVSTAIFEGTIFALKYNDGKVVAIDDNAFTDEGNPIIRERILSVIPLEDDQLRYFQSVELFTETGNTPVTQPDPQTMMKYSLNRGKTWSFERWVQQGGFGTYQGRTQWAGLGAGRGFAFWFRVVCDQYISWRKVRLRMDNNNA
jgi:hypothetical protein